MAEIDNGIPEVRGWAPWQVEMVRDMWSAGETGQAISETLIAESAKRGIAGKSRSAVIGLVNRCRFRRASGKNAKRSNPLNVVARNRQSPKVLRQAIAVHESRHAPQISLVGPSWSLPRGTRHVERNAAVGDSGAFVGHSGNGGRSGEVGHSVNGGQDVAEAPRPAPSVGRNITEHEFRARVRAVGYRKQGASWHEAAKAVRLSAAGLRTWYAYNRQAVDNAAKAGRG
jgi:hypothetical protein